ncbi:PKD-like family lipoprotein [Pedobacter sp. AW31-3R]|uniref:PKD-like family lipoprotein n=1 Tax=Pedobacter sp. AW31-3R TaxID=3445781 RepID=UPI003F9EF140
MKKVIWIAISFVSSCLLCASCAKDKGNYDYVELDKVVIDTANRNILSAYAIFRYDELKIDPKISFNNKEVTSTGEVSNDLSFTWSIYQSIAGGQVYKRDTLSHELILNKSIEKPAGSWIVILSVKNIRTQVEEYMKFSLQIDEQLSDGWMLLYGKDGNTDAGLIVDDWIKKGVVQPRTFVDMYSTSNGFPLPGEPRALLQSAGPIASAEVVISSSRDIAAVEKSSFQVFYPFEKLFWNPTAKGAEIKAVSANNLRKEVIIYNNRVHVVNFVPSGVQRVNFFGPALNGTYGDLAEWSATAFGAGYDAVVYDNTHKRFLNVPTGATSVQAFPEQLPTAAFDVNNVGLVPEAFDYGRGTGNITIGYEYSIMKNDTERYLLVSNFYSTVTANMAVAKYPVRGLPVSTPVRSLTSAFGGNYTLIGTDKEVYVHRYIEGSDPSIAWSAPANEEVTCVRIQKFFYNVALGLALMPKVNNVVYIATWNAGTKEGKVYCYLIDITNGNINQSSERVYGGFGRITDMAYKRNL